MFWLKDMANGGIFIARPDVQKLAVDGHLTMSRRGSAMIPAPSLISLNDKTMDILGGVPEAEKDEEKDEEKKDS